METQIRTDCVCGGGESCVQSIFLFIVTFLNIILCVDTSERR